MYPSFKCLCNTAAKEKNHSLCSLVTNDKKKQKNKVNYFVRNFRRRILRIKII